ncbi:ABC transporter substrate-binding protein, partial [Acinetobacter baumannii]
MIKKALLSVSILSAVVLGGCDNTAKVSEAKQDAQAAANTKPITIGYSDWPGWVAWQVAIEKGW